MPEVLQGEVFAASAPCLDQTSSSSSGKTVVVAWRALLDWVSFLLEILLQLLRGTPSLARALSSLCPSPPPSFKPLPAEIPPESVDPPLPRLTLVLDLDETLVCAYETSTLPDVIRSQAIEAGLTSFDLGCISSEKDADGRTKVNRDKVFERPGLQEFLQQTSEFADLVLFIAGLEGSIVIADSASVSIGLLPSRRYLKTTNEGKALVCLQRRFSPPIDTPRPSIPSFPIVKNRFGLPFLQVGHVHHPQ